MIRRSVVVSTSTGIRWVVFGKTAAHGGRCAVCQRGHGRGAAIYLAHGVPFCAGCVEGSRSAEVAERVAAAREARSRNG